ncbi:MAG: panthothenate synthetase [Zoogloea sp.]|nr:panthothenate synthetase [Zoogloea sp.]
MRFILHISLPVEKFNQALRDGTAGEKMRRILEDTKPEAAYFCAQDGRRGGFLIVDMADVSEMPRLAEPWFLQFDAAVEFMPTMAPQDMERAGLELIGKQWQ